MTSLARTRFIILLMIALTTLGASMSVWRFGLVQALEQTARRGEADLALASDRLLAQLRRYQELVVLMADHPHLDALMNGAFDPIALERAQELLLRAADKTAAVSLFFVRQDGEIIASAHANLPENIKDSGYFNRAMDGALGVSHGYSNTLNKRLFYFAAPSFAADKRVQAALVVALDIDRIEAEWRGGRPTVFFVDDLNSVFISNRSELLLWTRSEGQIGLTPKNQSADFSHKKIAGYEVWITDWGAYVPKEALHLTVELPTIQMIGEALVDVAPAYRIAWLQALIIAAFVFVVGGVALFTFERRRALARANAILEQRVVERTEELSLTNEILRTEIVERQEAEAALKRAQNDLVQAGKLSALGHMSAGISHELNQPLMVIQQYAENGAKFLDKGKPETAKQNLTQISAMASRMSRIIKNLRAFARNESEPMDKVDVVQVIEASLELTQAHLRQLGVRVQWSPPATAIYAKAGEVRLGQVVVNLITNAADAMGNSNRRDITIGLSQDDHVLITVQDTGPGIDQPDKIFEPFYTTKKVGAAEGMGLGLSISYGLVQSFGGNIRGENTQNGARFSVELAPWNKKDV